MRRFPLVRMAGIRLVQGVGILAVISVLIFAATMVLPGNVAVAILGKSATPESIAALEARLGLDADPVSQYLSWVGGLIQGDPGTSLANGEQLTAWLGPRLLNSVALVAIAGALSAVIGIVLGIYAARRRDSALDHSLSSVFLVITAMPEFVVGLLLVILFATTVWAVLPAVSPVPPDAYPWEDLTLLVLPVATLTLVVTPYIYRMTRGAMVEALDSEYVETARLKGVSDRRILFRHALLNAAPPIIQVTGIVFLYLAGGIVVVENVFSYPGIGEGLVASVSSRDVPAVQLVVLLLAAFYVLVNIATDIAALALTPRRRYPR